MKKLNYARYLIFKEWFPLFIVFTIIGLIAFFAYSMSYNFYVPDYNDTSLAALTAPMMTFAIVLPLFVFNYKYSLKRGDTYYQLPLSQRELKNTRVIVGLILVSAAFIIAASLPYIAYVIRYVCAPRSLKIGNYIYFKYFNAGPYLLAIIVGYFAIVIEYFISCFFTSLVSKPLSAVILNVSFHIVLLLSTYVLFKGIGLVDGIINETLYSSTYEEGANISVNFSAGPMMIISLPDYIVREFAYDFRNYGYSFRRDDFTRNVLILNIVIELLVGGISCFFTLFKKDDSGESCNNYGFANKKLNSLFFLSTIPVALFALVLSYSFGFEDVLGIVIAAATYYFLFALFIGSFKMPAYSYAIIGGMSALVIFGDLFISILSKTML